jgi:guanylate kinase
VLSLIEAADYPPILFEGKRIIKRKQQTLNEILEQLERIYQEGKTRSDIVFKSYVINSLQKLEEKLEHISNKIDEKIEK